MPRTIAYIRTSTEKQEIGNQKLEVLEYANQHNLHIDGFVEIAISSRMTTKQRRIDELMDKLQDADVLLVTELSSTRS